MKAITLLMALMGLNVARAADFAPDALDGKILTTQGGSVNTSRIRAFKSGGYDVLVNGGFDPLKSGEPFVYTKTDSNSATLTVQEHPMTFVYTFLFKGALGGTFVADVSDVTGKFTGHDPDGVFTLAEISLLPVANASLRTVVAPGQSAILGFIVKPNSGVKSLLFRAIGPGLSPFGITGAMANPKLEVFNGARSQGGNDDWAAENATLVMMNRLGAFALQKGSRDAVMMVPGFPGNYTVVVQGAAGEGGEVLIEAYVDR